MIRHPALSSLQSVVLVCLALLACLFSRSAAAADTLARQALMLDITTGAVLFEKNADQPMPPASMSKMMTAYLVFERLKQGKIKLDDTFIVSTNAWQQGGAASGGSTMFLKLGDRVRVEDLLRGIIVQSGNDASIVLAEGIAGTEAAFAEEMSRRGREMGLRGSTFRNSSGLPDPTNLTTARDLAVLAMRTINDFPEYYRYYAERDFTYNGIRQGNRNPLLYKTAGVDGLKTGHTMASGFGLTASATRGERRLILVLNGLPSMQARADEAERMLDYGFNAFENYRLFKAGEEIAHADTWYGESPSVPLVSAEDVVVTAPRQVRPQMKVTVSYAGPILAPIRKGTEVAVLKIAAPNVPMAERPLVAGTDVERLGMGGRMMFTLGHLVGLSD